jgi:hypothetical protein
MRGVVATATCLAAQPVRQIPIDSMMAPKRMNDPTDKRCTDRVKVNTRAIQGWIVTDDARKHQTALSWGITDMKR